MAAVAPSPSYPGIFARILASAPGFVPLQDLQKARACAVGTVHTWADGSQHRKVGPGEWVDVGPQKHAPQDVAKRDKAATAAAAAIAFEPVEHLVIIGGNGVVIGRAKGTARRVDVPQAAGEVAEHDGHAVMVHNHPAGEMLSMHDIVTASRWNLAEVHAVGPTADGRQWHAWIARRGRARWPEEHKLLAALRTARLSVADAVAPDFDAPSGQLLALALNEEFRRRGWALEVKHRG